MRKSYPSDISREQFEIIKPLLENARKRTCPQAHRTLRGALPARERLPVAHAARGVFQVAHCALLLYDLERAA